MSNGKTSLLVYKILQTNMVILIYPRAYFST